MIINGYFTLYDLESDDGWSELYNLNDILNTDVSNIESILNVYVRDACFNNILFNFESYIGYGQN